MLFTTKIWTQNTHIYEKILHHPFTQELFTGSLPQSIFSYYIEQDSLYLNTFSKVLSIIATKAPEIDDYYALLSYAQQTIALERTVVHDFFKKKFSIHSKEIRSLTPATIGYTNTLLSYAYHKSYEVSLASILPCFWIYYHLGLESQHYLQEDNPYIRWIETYAGQEFQESVHKLLTLIDCYAQQNTGIQQEMEFACATSFIWEYHFCNDVYMKSNFFTTE